MKRTIPFNLLAMKQDQPVVIYGASTYGEIAYFALQHIGVEAAYFCDRSRCGRYFDIEIIKPDKLKELLNANIIIASSDYFYDIKDKLEKIGCKNIFDMRDLISMDISENLLSERARDMYLRKDSYLAVVERQGHGTINFPRIQYVVTERCSLRCRDCISLMQYYDKPQDIDIDKYDENFDRFLSLTDHISDLRILGGEPFMNINTYKLVEKCVTIEKIATISIYTNGTIIPNERNLRAMENKKVILHISNYLHNEERVSRLVEKLGGYNIKYFVRKYDSWEECGQLRFHDYSTEKMEDIFSRCIDRECYTFYRGQLHRCPRSAHAMNLNAMPNILKDYVDFTDKGMTDEILREQMLALQRRTWIEACNYCQGPDYGSGEHIPAAIQIDKPLKYTKIAYY